MPHNASSQETGQQFEGGKGSVTTGGNPADRFAKRLRSLENYRFDFEQDWLDIQRFVLPRKGMFYRRGQKPSDFSGKVRDHSSIIDPETTLDLKDLASALLAGMTPKTRPWLRLGLQDVDMMDSMPVKAWFHEATTKMLDIFSFSNLYTGLHSVYRETAAFGTGPILEEEDIDTMVRFTSFTTGEFYVGVNARGEVDVFYRQFEMTADNIVAKFGIDRVTEDVVKEFEKGQVSSSIKDAADRPDAKDKYFTICHAIQPNKNAKFGFIDNQNMPFESVYWEKSKPGQLLRHAGFEELPVFTARWDISSTEIPYGESPVRDILNHSKMLQEMSKDELRAINQQARPSTQVPAQFKGRLSFVPGAQNVMPAGDAKVERLFDFQFDHTGVQAKIEDVREQIRRGLFIDLIKMISFHPGIQPLTAAEVAAREGERLTLLSPILERFQSDLLNNLVKRTFNIMLRHGVLEEPPPEIQGARIKVVYTSQLAQLQKIIGLQPIENFLGFLERATGIQTAQGGVPQILDKVDFDEMADEFGDAAGVPPKIIVGTDGVAEIREARRLEAEAQQRDAIAQGMLEAGKTLGDTSTEEGTALGDMIEQGAPQ